MAVQDLYEDDIEDDFMTLDFWVYMLMRVMGAMLIPFWLLVGLITCGKCEKILRV